MKYEVVGSEQLRGSDFLIMFDVLPHSPIVTSIYIVHLQQSGLRVGWYPRNVHFLGYLLRGQYILFRIFENVQVARACTFAGI